MTSTTSLFHATHTHKGHHIETSGSSSGVEGATRMEASPETQKAEQTDGLRRPRKPCGAGHLTAPELQPASTSASNQPPDSFGHRPRATRSHCLIGASIADMQEVGVDVAKSDAELFSRHVAAITDGPGLEGHEDLVVGTDEVAVLNRVGGPAAKRNASF